jgi:hypothetical protein
MQTRAVRLSLTKPDDRQKRQIDPTSEQFYYLRPKRMNLPLRFDQPYGKAEDQENETSYFCVGSNLVCRSCGVYRTGTNRLASKNCPEEPAFHSFLFHGTFVGYHSASALTD